MTTHLTSTQPLFGITTSSKDANERANEFGVDFVDLHFGGNESSLRKAVELLEAAQVGYIPNFEGAPIDWVPTEKLKKELSQSTGFLGFMLDEADHMQLNAHWPVIAYYGYNEKHYLVDTEGMDLLTAQEAVYQALQKRSASFQIGQKAGVVEHLFPVMMHTVAKAGLNVSPKILKETCGPAMLAVGLGAARQYGVNFSVDVDYWWHNETLGHSLERFISALKLAYWSGADQVYVEGGAQWSKEHPLGKQIETAYKDFLSDYIPVHPRPYNWQSFQPEIAIIRFDDTCFDIRQGVVGEYPGPLYGHVPAGPENTEWLNIWSLLSHGFMRTDSASHQWETRRFNSRTLFVPLNNVAVYDHEVSYEILLGLRLIFLTGIKISPSALEAVSRCVREGAVCVLPPRLAPSGTELEHIAEFTTIPDEKGKWLVVPDFYRLHYEAFFGGPAQKSLREALQGLTGDGDTLRYRFGKYDVRFRQEGWDYPKHEIMTCFLPLTQAGSNPDVLEVDIQEATSE